MVHICGESRGAGDLSSTGSGLTCAFGAEILSLRILSPLGRDAEHSSLGISASAPLRWRGNRARERTGCRMQLF